LTQDNHDVGMMPLAGLSDVGLEMHDDDEDMTFEDDV
jgi:hypothetical protein